MFQISPPTTTACLRPLNGGLTRVCQMTMTLGIQAGTSHRRRSRRRHLGQQPLRDQSLRLGACRNKSHGLMAVDIEKADRDHESHRTKVVHRAGVPMTQCLCPMTAFPSLTAACRRTSRSTEDAMTLAHPVLDHTADTGMMRPCVTLMTTSRSQQRNHSRHHRRRQTKLT